MSSSRRIVVAVDFSEHSDLAVEQAVGLAKITGAELHLVHAFELPIHIVSPYEVAVPTPYIEESRKSAGQRLEALVEKVRGMGVAAEAHLTEVPAAPAIARTAKELGAELVVIGTRGLTGLKHLVLGSVAERTLRLCPCSVLVVKGEDDHEDAGE